MPVQDGQEGWVGNCQEGCDGVEGQLGVPQDGCDGLLGQLGWEGVEGVGQLGWEGLLGQLPLGMEGELGQLPQLSPALVGGLVFFQLGLGGLGQLPSGFGFQSPPISGHWPSGHLPQSPR